MAGLTVGLSTGCFHRQPIVECLDLITAHGFMTLEICSYPEHLDYHNLPLVCQAAAELRQRGFAIYSYHAPFADTIDITDPRQDGWRASVEEMLAAAETAAVLGARYFVLHPGPEKTLAVSAGECAIRQERGMLALREIAGRCRQLGIAMVLENMLQHLSFGRLEDLLRCLDGLADFGCRACLDTGHGFLSGRLDALAAALAPRLEMVHAHDNRGRFDDHLPPGTGLINWPRLMARLIASGFAGCLILELALAERQHPATLLSMAQDARLYLLTLAARQAKIP